MPCIKEITLTIAWILFGVELFVTSVNSLDPAPGRSPGPPSEDQFNVLFSETKKTTPRFIDFKFSEISYSHEVEADGRSNTIHTTVRPPTQFSQQQVDSYTTNSETMTATSNNKITKQKYAEGDTPIVTLQHISSSTSSLSLPSSFSPSSFVPSLMQQQHRKLPCNKHGTTKETESEFIKADDKIVRISNDDVEVDDAVQFDVTHDVFDTNPATTNLVAGIVYKGKHVAFIKDKIKKRNTSNTISVT